MVIFFNDIELDIRDAATRPDPSHFQVCIDLNNEDLLPEKLIHNVLILGAKKSNIDTILDLLHKNVFNQVTSITILVKDHVAAKDYFKSKFKIVKAAGGVVEKKDKILMIYRLKKWDLPKGKLDKGEKAEEAALREVEEECNIKVELGAKICNSWHTYSLNEKNILKKTSWYVMRPIDHSNMKPQKSENIEEVKWLKTKDLFHALEDSYRSIRWVFKKYRELAESTSNS
jgi:ADP-ribose pyrophosphatase YjhB (NUDIX family)